MAKKTTLKVETSAGEFTRTTATAYTHAVVRKSPRAQEYVDGVAAGTKTKHRDGVHGRWLKDRGYVVTWHGSEAAARKAAAKPYDYDRETTVVGVFAVADLGGWEPHPTDPTGEKKDGELLLAARSKRK